MTARELIKGSLRLIGAIDSGETPAANEASDALVALNHMLDSWSTESLIISSFVREEFSLVSGTARYSIGTGGTFNTSRPIAYDRITFEDQSNTPTTESPIEIINVDQWAAIVSKDSSGIPTKVWIEGTSPLDYLNFYPKPNSTDKAVIYSQKPLTSISTLDTVIDTLPGYLRAIRYNLAIELAPEYGKSVSAEVSAIASEAKANMKRLNAKHHLLTTDTALVQSQPFNIITGV